VEVRNRQRKEIEFLAVGHLAVDQRDGQFLLGGAAAYGALTASRLGLASAVVTAVGEDFDFFRPLESVEVWFHQQGVSTSFENLYSNGIRQQRLLGRARPLTEESLLPLQSRLAEDAIVFYCPLARELETPLRPLTPRGICGLAPQGFFREWDEEGRVTAAPWPEARARLGAVEVVSLSETDPADLDEFVSQVQGKVGVLALTAGAQPVELYAGGHHYRVPVLARPEVDPTGAGDVFAAALLVGLAEGRSPLEATRLACAAASFAVERPGVEGVPANRQAVEARLLEHRQSCAAEEVPGR
jgi:sugar/nucleoside kinase (ribokinase family)